MGGGIYLMLRDRNSDRCRPVSDCPRKILLECGPIGDTMTFDRPGQTFTAANVTVDTTCFKKPFIEIQFTGQVDATLESAAYSDAEIKLLYELICRPSGGNETTIGSWTFKRFLSAHIIEESETTDTVEDTECPVPFECVSLVGFDEYFVRVTATCIRPFNGDNNTSATVSRGQLVAKIQEY